MNAKTQRSQSGDVTRANSPRAQIISAQTLFLRSLILLLVLAIGCQNKQSDRLNLSDEDKTILKSGQHPVIHSAMPIAVGKPPLLLIVHGPGILKIMMEGQAEPVLQAAVEAGQKLVRVDAERGISISTNNVHPGHLPADQTYQIFFTGQ